MERAEHRQNLPDLRWTSEHDGNNASRSLSLGTGRAAQANARVPRCVLPAVGSFLARSVWEKSQTGLIETDIDMSQIHVRPACGFRNVERTTQYFRIDFAQGVQQVCAKIVSGRHVKMAVSVASSRTIVAILTSDGSARFRELG